MPLLFGMGPLLKVGATLMRERQRPRRAWNPATSSEDRATANTPDFKGFKDMSSKNPDKALELHV